GIDDAGVDQGIAVPDGRRVARKQEVLGEVLLDFLALLHRFRALLRCPRSPFHNAEAQADRTARGCGRRPANGSRGRPGAARMARPRRRVRFPLGMRFPGIHLALLSATALAACGADAPAPRAEPWVPRPTPAATVDSEHGRLRVETLVEGLEHPWSLAFLPDGGMLVTERPGRLRR